jgi:hypothetical protein
MSGAFIFLLYLPENVRLTNTLVAYEALKLPNPRNLFPALYDRQCPKDTKIIVLLF